MQDDNGEGSSTHQPEKVKAKATVERQQKKQKRKAAEGKLQVKRQEMDKAKVRLFHSSERVFFTHLSGLVW